MSRMCNRSEMRRGICIDKTEDGGATWTRQFKNELAGAFYDCFAFWSPTRGISHSDSVNGVFPDIRTEAGTHGRVSRQMQAALPGEASFAASGTCVATQGTNNAWIATGGAPSTHSGDHRWRGYLECS